MIPLMASSYVPSRKDSPRHTSIVANRVALPLFHIVSQWPDQDSNPQCSLLGPG